MPAHYCTFANIFVPYTSSASLHSMAWNTAWTAWYVSNVLIIEGMISFTHLLKHQVHMLGPNPPQQWSIGTSHSHEARNILHVGNSTILAFQKEVTHGDRLEFHEHFHTWYVLRAIMKIEQLELLLPGCIWYSGTSTSLLYRFMLVWTVCLSRQSCLGWMLIDPQIEATWIFWHIYASHLLRSEILVSKLGQIRNGTVVKIHNRPPASSVGDCATILEILPSYHRSVKTPEWWDGEEVPNSAWRQVGAGRELNRMHEMQRKN